MMMSDADAKIALLIDADNSPAAKIDVILSELAKYGVVYVRRAYGNWKSTNLKSWEEVLHEYAIQPIQQFDYSKGKNATDIRLVIDAMDLLYTHKLDAFGIVSSDCDFTPLIMRIHADGLKVYGFGEKKTPEPFRNACSTFTFLEALGLAEEANGAQPQTPPPPVAVTVAAAMQPKVSESTPKPPLKSDTKLMNLLRSAVDATAGENGWSLMSAVGTHISNKTSFDSRNYGFSKLSDLFQACDLFEVARSSNKILMVRQRKKPVTVAASTPVLAKPVVAAPAPNSQKESADVMEERYWQILKEKAWERISKFALMNFYRVMKNVPCSNKQELVSHTLKIKLTATEAEAKKAFNVFWKARLFKVSDDTAGQKQIELIDFPDYLERIDKALLSRLIGGCQEQNLALDSHVVAGMLLADYGQGDLESMIETVRQELGSRSLSVAGQD